MGGGQSKPPKVQPPLPRQAPPAPAPAPAPPPPPPKVDEPEEIPVEKVEDSPVDEYKVDIDANQFPSPATLRQYNEQLLQHRGHDNKHNRSKDGHLLPGPSSKNRDQIFTLDDLTRLDNIAASVPEDLLQRPISELIDHFRQVASTNHDLVRVAYSWVLNHCSDRGARATYSGSPVTVSDYISDVTDDKFTRNDLLGKLLSLARLDVQVVSGVVKSDNQDNAPMSTLPSPLPQTVRRDVVKAGGPLTFHRWLAVDIDDSWYLIDAYPEHERFLEMTGLLLGTLHIQQTTISSPDSQKTDHVTDDHAVVSTATTASGQRPHYLNIETYFMASPEHFIYSHFPGERDWQLLARPVTIEEFMRLADLKAPFFRLELEPTSGCLERNIKFIDDRSKGGDDDVDASQMIINLEQRRDSRYRYNYRLSKIVRSGIDGGAESTSNSDQLDRYALIENRTDGLVRCALRFPTSGRYMFELYSYNVDDVDKPVYRLICVYRIDVTVVNAAGQSQLRQQPLPLNRRREWGPGWELKRSGLLASSHEAATIHVKNQEELNVEFDVLSDNEDDCGKHLVHVISDRKSKNDMKRFVLFYDDVEVSGRHRLIVRAKFPDPGLYALSILTRKKKSGRNVERLRNDDVDDDDDDVIETPIRFSPVCCYLVIVSLPTNNPSPYPKVTSGRLGPTELASRLDVRAISHRSGYFRSPNDGELKMTFEARSVPCSFMAELRIQRPGDLSSDGKELVDMVFVDENVDGSEATFSVRFPEKGVYTLRIFGRDSTRPADRYSPLFTYIIEVSQPTSKFGPFPRRFSHWTNGCRLIRPADLTGILAAHSTIPFVISIPGAVSARLVKSDGQSTSMEKQDLHDGLTDSGVDTSDLWCLDFNTGPEGELTVYAQFQRATPEQSKKLIGFQILQVAIHANQPGTRKDGRTFLRATTTKTHVEIWETNNLTELPKEDDEVTTNMDLKLDIEESVDEEENIEVNNVEEVDTRKSDRQKELERTRHAEQEKHTTNEQVQREVEQRHAIYRQQDEHKINSLRRALKVAMDQRDMDALLDAIETVESHNLQSKLGDYYTEATKMYDSMERVERQRSAVLAMTPAMMTELRSYNNPPETLRLVLSATLLILGTHERDTATWPACQREWSTTGRDNLRRRVKEFYINRLEPEIAARALQILDECQEQERDKINKACDAAAILFDWTSAMCEERLAMHGRKVQPAKDAKKQKLLLDQMEGNKLSRWR